MKLSRLGYFLDLNNANQQGFGPAFRLVVDDKQIDYFIIPAALEYSLKNNGILPIFNCSCGVVGCGGAYVKVAHKKDRVVWEKLYSGTSCGEEIDEKDDEVSHMNFRTYALVAEDKSELNLPLEFSAKNYKAVIMKILSSPEFKQYEEQGYIHDKNSFAKKDFFMP